MQLEEKKALKKLVQPHQADITSMKLQSAVLSML